MVLGFMGTVATAQLVPLPNPVPYASWPIGTSSFYIQVGARYRAIDTVRMRQEAAQMTYQELGVPPFGPNVTGEFGTGTGVAGYPTNPLPGNFNPNLSGFWQYNNGFIDPRAPNDLTVDGGNFPYPQGTEVMLGRFVQTRNVPGHITETFNIGSFQINDTFLQVDNPQGVVANTIRVSWSRVIDGTYPAGSPEVQSRLFDGTGFTFDARFDPGLWTPSFEFGYQASNFFDVFYGFSSFSYDAAVSRSIVIQANFGRRGFTDTFSFYSRFPYNWMIKDFNTVSALQPGIGLTPGEQCPDINDELVANFRIWPDGVGQGAYPVRQFYEVFPADAPKENLRQEINQKVDIGVHENRLGGRSWTLLNGIGRLGVSLGALISPITYRISGTKRITSLGPQLSGTMFENAAEVQTGVWWNFGAFVGTDLQMQYGSLFARGAVEYSLCRNQSASLFQVETTINPGGFATLLSAGYTF